MHGSVPTVMDCAWGSVARAAAVAATCLVPAPAAVQDAAGVVLSLPVALAFGVASDEPSLGVDPSEDMPGGLTPPGRR